MGIKSFFKAASPFLGTVAQMAIPGPAGAIAAGILSKVTGGEVKPENLQDALQQLTTTSEGIAKLKAAEQEFQAKMAELGYDHIEKMEQLEDADRDSARKREMEVKDRTPMILAFLITVGFFSLLIFLCKYAPPAANERVLDIMLGSLGGAWLAVVGYYFGSSKSSDRKTELLAKAPAIQS